QLDWRVDEYLVALTLGLREIFRVDVADRGSAQQRARQDHDAREGGGLGRRSGGVNGIGPRFEPGFERPISMAHAHGLDLDSTEEHAADATAAVRVQQRYATGRKIDPVAPHQIGLRALERDPRG